MRQNVRTLRRALKNAQRAGDRDAAQEIRQQITELQEAIAETATTMIERAREIIKAKAQDLVDWGELGNDRISAIGGGIEAGQRLRGTTDTPGGMRERGQFQLDVVAPGFNRLADAFFKQARDLATIDPKASFAAFTSGLNAANMATNALADGFDLVRGAAMKAASDFSDIAGHNRRIADLDYEGFGLDQKLAGTFDTPGGALARGNYIRDVVLPKIAEEQGAKRKEYDEAVRQGNHELARILFEALKGLDNDWKRGMLESNEQTAEATKQAADQLKEMGGSIGFEFGGAITTDRLADLGLGT